MKKTTTLKATLTICFISLCSFGFAQTFNFMHNAVSRSYIVHLPPSYTPTNSYPLVINMHGFGSDATQQQFYAEMDQVADTANFIVVYPFGIADSWNSGQIWSYNPGINDVTFISALIDTMAINFSINTSMVYACGMSNGGFMSYKLACELEDKIAAISSVTGVMADSVFASCQTDRPVPIMHIHGTADPTVPYAGAQGGTPVETGIDWWVTNNNCPPTKVVSNIPDINTTDGSTVEKWFYGPCDNNSEVVLFKITGGEHTWPGVTFIIGVTNQDMDGSGESWLFFRKHAMTTLLSQSENPRASQLKVWPNPGTDDVFVTGDILADAEISIINLMGQVIQMLPPNGAKTGQVRLDVSNMDRGMYLIKIADSEKTTTHVFVKQ